MVCLGAILIVTLLSIAHGDSIDYGSIFSNDPTQFNTTNDYGDLFNMDETNLSSVQENDNSTDLSIDILGLFVTDPTLFEVKTPAPELKTVVKPKF